MTTKHAPGPWFIWEGGVYSGRPKVMKRGELSGYDAKICGIDDMYGTARSRKANARLIAAAPDLLEALQQYGIGFTDESAARAEFGDYEVDRELKRRAAIAKATGEQP